MFPNQYNVFFSFFFFLFSLRSTSEWSNGPLERICAAQCLKSHALPFACNYWFFSCDFSSEQVVRIKEVHSICTPIFVQVLSFVVELFIYWLSFGLVCFYLHSILKCKIPMKQKSTHGNDGLSLLGFTVILQLQEGNIKSAWTGGTSWCPKSSDKVCEMAGPVGLSLSEHCGKKPGPSPWWTNDIFSEEFAAILAPL